MLDLLENEKPDKLEDFRVQHKEVFDEVQRVEREHSSQDTLPGGKAQLRSGQLQMRKDEFVRGTRSGRKGDRHLRGNVASSASDSEEEKEGDRTKPALKGGSKKRKNTSKVVKGSKEKEKKPAGKVKKPKGNKPGDATSGAKKGDASPTKKKSVIKFPGGSSKTSVIENDARAS